MSRRRLKLTYSSSDEDDGSPRHHRHHHNNQQQDDTDSIRLEESTPEIIIAEEALASTTLNPNLNYDFPSPPMEISDDEIVEDDVFIDVSDHLSPPSPEDVNPSESFQPPPSRPSYQSGDNVSPPSSVYSVAEEEFVAVQVVVREEGDVSLIREVLSRLGLRLKMEWLTECLRGLERSVSGFGSFSVDRKAELCFGQFLLSDMNYSGAGVLPENLCGLHLEDLAGPFVLQVDEIVNMSCPLRQRYQKAAPGNKRCLKLSMTDGIHRVFGMEYRPIKDLDVLAPAGLKVAIRNVHVRHGLLIIVPEVIEILGGMAEELEAAHQRIAAEINKPPRGRRPRMGDIPPLATRATRVAWPSALPGVHEPARNSGPHNSDSMQAPVGVSARGGHQLNDSGAPSRMICGGDIPNSTSHQSGAPFRARSASDISNSTSHQSGAPFRVRNGGYTPNPILLTDAQATRPEPQHNSRTIDAPTLPSREAPSICPKEGATGSVLDQTRHFRPQHSSLLHTSAGDAHEFDKAPHRSTPTEDVEMTNAGINRDARASCYFSNEDNRETTDFSRLSNNFIDLELEDIDMTDNVVETMVNSRPTEMDQSSNSIGDTEDTNMHDEGENPLMIPDNQEVPFTYLTSLSAELLAAEDSIASVKGKIKCFLTGVKIFQYQGRKSYELRVYVEDGSLISEILIDHNVVRDRIGYSPMEIIAAISSSDANTVSRIKEIMKQFRSFLMTFEGTMTVELKKSSPVPVAIEMGQGCPSSDARLLLRRVKSYLTVQTPQNSEPIVLPP